MPVWSLSTLARLAHQMVPRTSLVVSLSPLHPQQPSPSLPLLLTHSQEKIGIPRVLEALESNDWESFAAADDQDDDMAGPGDASKRSAEDGDDGSDIDPENLDFGFDREDFEGLRQAIWEASAERQGCDGHSQGTESRPGAVESASAQTRNRDERGDELGDQDIQKVEQMMRKLQAVKDMSAGLPEDQKKRMAARAVGEVMRDL
jgi:alpha- and gamma-adaptin-binding protein p34